MYIFSTLLNDILSSMPSVPPEEGGILGGKSGEICIWKYDEGIKERGCVYRPNVDFLNRVISLWMEEGYDFMGILHVHFGGAKLLSEGDKRYIEKIMEAMPDFVKTLYFPLVVQPEKEFVSYKAVLNPQGKLEIVLDDVRII